ncbi:MAG: hypothetical protein RBT36_09285, partial [Desulfobulbus sp.]|nr:hypothetical protein [Desulfobulbus sp.]
SSQKNLLPTLNRSNTVLNIISVDCYLGVEHDRVFFTVMTVRKWLAVRRSPTGGTSDGFWEKSLPERGKKGSWR